MSRARERGKFIRSRMMDIAIRESIGGKGEHFFSVVYAMISDVNHAGNAKTVRCANYPPYLQALEAWRGIFQQRYESYLKQKGG